MASILNRGGLALALITLIIVGSSFRTISVADARRPYNHVRILASDCNSPRQGEVAGYGVATDVEVVDHRDPEQQVIHHL
ncbi:hypothetical protein HanRHA438_Chr12g0548811 [Helianthus annuus]|nr:hypothetical protein HanRHA438_Chr12g0548811 [Helianthus annuus]